MKRFGRIDPQDVINRSDGRLAAEADRLAKRRHKIANRISDRVLRSIHDGELAVVVRSGPLGMMKTGAEDAVYPIVAGKLRDDGVEVTVHRVAWLTHEHLMPVTIPVADVVTAVSIWGRPVEAPISPTKNPAAFDGRSHTHFAPEEHAAFPIYPPSTDNPPAS